MNKNNYSDYSMNSSDKEYVVEAEKAIEWIYLGDIFVAVWNKIYKMSLNEPMKKIGVVASIDDRNNLIDGFANELINKIESKYCQGDLTSQYIGMQTCEWIREIAETMKR